jgi:hypothetical protein
MEALTFLPKNKEQLTALKAIAKAMKIDFKTVELTDREKAIDLYGLPIVEKLEQGREDFKNGKGVKIKIEDLWK